MKCIEQLILFTRYPEPGKTKTRLIPVLGEKGAADLQRYMAEDILNRLIVLQRNHSIKIEVRYAGGSRSLMEEWLGTEVRYTPQREGDLGERMRHAFTDAFQVGTEKAVIIGTDSPDIPEDIVRTSFHLLTLNHAVIGPAYDGGYYLIGFSRDSFESEVFKDIQWGRGTVCKTTVNILKKSGRSVHLLPKKRDIDTVDDLRNLIKSKNKDLMTSKTISYLSKTSLLSSNSM